MSHKIIVIAVPLESNLIQLLYPWGARFNWSEVREVHLIHIVKKYAIPLEFGLLETPPMADYTAIRSAIKKSLEQESKKIIPPDFKGTIKYNVEEDYSPESRIIDELTETNASLVVIVSHCRKRILSLFHKSFTEQLIKASPCDIYIVRSDTKE